MADRDSDLLWNHLQLQNRPHLASAGNGIYSYVPHYSTTRPNGYPLTSSSTNVPPFRLPTSGPSHMMMHSLPATNSSTAFPSYYLQREPSFHQSIRQGEEFGIMGSLDNGRGRLKRKWSLIPMEYDARNTAGYSSGSLQCHLQHKPMSGFPYPLMEYDSMFSNPQGIDLSQRDSQRNVRCRHSSDIHFGADSSRSHFSQNFPFHLNVIRDLPGPSTRPWNYNLASVSFNPGVPSVDPQSSISETIWPFHGSNSGNAAYAHHQLHQNSVYSRRFPSPFIVPGPAQGMVEGSARIHEVLPPWRATPGPLPSEIVATSLGGSNHPVPEYLCRHPMSVSITEPQHSRGRSGRIRDSHSRFHPLSTVSNSRARWIPQGFTNRRILYDSTFSLDQHLDMRLDIDNMSYEDLLALGESIGSVNTGLSTDVMSTCLTKSKYQREMQDEEDDENCAICLESYGVGEELGSLKCGHGFHFCCIKKWLEIKNNCPICKAAAWEK